MILVFNPGSSSLKYKVFENKDELFEVASGSVDGIDGSADNNHSAATRQLSGQIRKQNLQIDFVGYRIVHGCGILHNGDLADENNLAILRKNLQLAALHNPQAIEVITAAEPFFGRASHQMFFDTDYFADLPDYEKTYPLSLPIAEEYGIRRFGFHGISHKFMSGEVDHDNKENLITLHLGAGCSVSAIASGQPLTTSMGFTPDEGLIMQTRSGDLDPGIVLYLVDKVGIEKTRSIIEKESGLAGLTGTNGNMLDILYLAGEKIEDPSFVSSLSRSDKNREQASLALRLYIQRIQRYIAYYVFVLKRVDKLVFSGKIGFGSSVIRNMITKDIEHLPISEFLIVKPDEELAIAREILSLSH